MQHGTPQRRRYAPHFKQAGVTAMVMLDVESEEQLAEVGVPMDNEVGRADRQCY